jgi:hypothetical protein
MPSPRKVARNKMLGGGESISVIICVHPCPPGQELVYSSLPDCLSAFVALSALMYVLS